MRNVLKSLFLAATLVLGAVGCTYVPPGNVAVIVDLTGTEKGVNQEVRSTGRIWPSINQEVYFFPTFTQNEVWTGVDSISFQSSEGMGINAAVGIAYRIEPDKVPFVFQKYRRGIEEISDVALRNIVKDAMVAAGSTRPVETLYGAGKSAFLAEVNEDVKRRAAAVGITVESVSLSGGLALPRQVLAAINAKVEATQKTQQRENEVAQAKAEADKKIEEARGIAQSMQIQNVEVTDKILRLKELEIKEIEARRWNGVLPQTIMGTSAVPIFNTNK